MSKPKRRRGRVIAIGALVVLVVAGFFIFRAVRGTASTGVTQYVTAPAQNTTILTSVSGTGNVTAGASASVNPGITGEVEGLTVAVGDPVTKGELLFTIVNPQLALDVVTAQNSYNQAVQGVNNAELSLLQAQANLDSLEKQKAAESTSTTAPPTSTLPTTTLPTTTTTRPHPTTTSSSSSSTTTSSTTTSTTEPSSTTSTSESTTTTTAEPATTTTTHPHPTTTTLSGSGGAQLIAAAATQPAAQTSQTSTTVSELDIEVAEQQVTNAEYALTTAKTQVVSAQLQLQQAKDTAAKRNVTAPMAGVVTAVNVQNGDTLGSSGSSSSTGATGGSAGSSTAPIVITDQTTYGVTVALTEVDIVGVKVGDKATFTFDALPSLTATGHVDSVDSQGTNNQGVVSYNVNLIPDTNDPTIRAGMTATANIITDVKTDVLAVLSTAVKSSGGQSYVQLLQGGKPVSSTGGTGPVTTSTTNSAGTSSSQQTYVGGTLVTQTVVVGVSDSTYTEITSGLTAGQEVVVRTIAPAGKGNTTTTSRGGGGIGIPGLGGGGGGGRFTPGG